VPGIHLHKSHPYTGFRRRPSPGHLLPCLHRNILQLNNPSNLQLNSMVQLNNLPEYCCTHIIQRTVVESYEKHTITEGTTCCIYSTTNRNRGNCWYWTYFARWWVSMFAGHRRGLAGRKKRTACKLRQPLMHHQSGWRVMVSENSGFISKEGMTTEMTVLVAESMSAPLSWWSCFDA